MSISTDAQVKAAKLPEGKKSQKIGVSDGLYLLLNKSGKYWRYSYRYDGKRKDYSIGTYPVISLKHAKLSLAEVKKQLADGIDPNKAKQQMKQACLEANRQQQVQAVSDANTFERVGREWFEVAQTAWADSHASKQQCRLKKHLYPAIGHIPVNELKRQQIADLLKLVAEVSSPDIARRIAQMCKSILNYACNSGLIEAVPMGDTNKLLPAPISKKMPVITDSKRLGEFLRAIQVFQGSYVVAQALKLLPYLAVRAGEFRMAEWREFDLDEAVWTIPANHRKLKKAAKDNPENIHVVPLSTQAVLLLKEIRQLTGRGKHVFPSVRGDMRPMSDAAINTAIAAIGFKGEMVGHGWRSVFSTTLNEQNFNPDAIERQLAMLKKIESEQHIMTLTIYLSESL